MVHMSGNVFAFVFMGFRLTCDAEILYDYTYVYNSVYIYIVWIRITHYTWAKAEVGFADKSRLGSAHALDSFLHYLFIFPLGARLFSHVLGTRPYCDLEVLAIAKPDTSLVLSDLDHVEPNSSATG